MEEVYPLLAACIHYIEHVLPCPFAQLRSGYIAYLPLDDSFADDNLCLIIMEWYERIIEHFE